MKKTMLAVLMVFFLIVPAAYGQFRLDIGVDIPLAVGLSYEGEFINSEVSEFLTSHILPFPELGAHYFFTTGPVRVGLGVRGFTFIIETIMWPNAVVEFEAGRFVLEGQFGGGGFLFFGLFSQVNTGAVFIPDLSAWFKLGETFRLGGGVLGLMTDAEGFDGVPMVFYVGGKAAIKF